MKKKSAALLIACTLAFGCAVGGTMAWLTDSTKQVVNTFTVGDINIGITETGTTEKDNSLIKSYSYVPGDTLEKDPKVTVSQGSEECYLFVKIEESNNSVTGLTGNVLTWSVRDGWTSYSPKSTSTNPNVHYYYKMVTKNNTKDQSWYILKGKHETNCSDPTSCDCKYANGYVTVNKEITKNMVTSLNSAKPSLTFTAAAVQSANIASVADAWEELPAGFTN